MTKQAYIKIVIENCENKHPKEERTYGTLYYSKTRQICKPDRDYIVDICNQRRTNW